MTLEAAINRAEFLLRSAAQRDGVVVIGREAREALEKLIDCARGEMTRARGGQEAGNQ